MACSPSDDSSQRSAHKLPHHAQDCGSAQVQVELLACTLPKPACEGPPLEEPSGVGLAAVAARDRAVEFKPARKQWIERRPPKARVVAVTRGEHTASPQHAPHLGQARAPGRSSAARAGARAPRRTKRLGTAARTPRQRAVRSTRFAHWHERSPARELREHGRCRLHGQAPLVCARSTVIVPGPQPTSRRSSPGRRAARR